ncbi:efflux RND transporter periplasmic adaptor subunit [Candidatus Kaiserbacteria bacterium]|nr:efflux RND transporter periplasmic adaptor subunit [Candidatus Kaiserbacteria bacterium]
MSVTLVSLTQLLKAKWRYALAAVAVVLGGYFLISGGSAQDATLVIVPGDFTTQVAVSGSVVAAREVALGFAASGRVAGVYAQVGQHVYTGQLLASVENGDLAASVDEKKAALASLLAGTRPEKLAVDQATLADALRSAYTAADDAIHNVVDAFFNNPRTDPKLTFSLSNSVLKSAVEQDRLTLESVLAAWKLSLGNASAISVSTSLSQLSTFLAEANAAINQATPDQKTSAATLSSYTSLLASARANVNVATAVLDSAEKSLALDEAGPTVPDVTAAEAEVAAAEAALAKTQVRAPFSGIVTRMEAKAGAIVSPSDAQISLQSDGVFQIETYVPEVAIAGVVPGLAATTTLDAYGPTAVFAASVIAVDPAETLKDGVPTYKTTLSFRAADPRIRSGMTTNVRITTGTLANAIVVPAGAVANSGGGSYVSVVENKKTIKRAVTTGIAPALGQVQIISGLSAGDIILLAP